MPYFLDKPLSPYYIAKMTWREIEAHIKAAPVIILPVGVNEPCTEFGALGAAGITCWAMANTLSEKKSILLAPMVTYGYSSAFKAFSGCAAVSPKTMTAYVFDIMRSWVGQGIKTIITIDNSIANADAVIEAAKRLRCQYPSAHCQVLNWQRMSDIRTFIAQQLHGSEYGMSQFGLLSLAAYLDKSYVRLAAARGSEPLAATVKEFERWKKTGADPEKFRKLFPDCRTSDIAGCFSIEFGEKLFCRIMEQFETALTKELPQ